MTDTIDPFAPKAEEPAETPAPKKTTAKKAAATKKKETVTVTEAGEGKVTATLKGGAGFDAPWIVIHGDSVADVYEQFDGENAALLADLMEKVANAGKHFSSLGPVKAAASSSGGGAPQGSQEPPAGAPPAPGPDWVFKSGVGKTGKPWKAWMPPRGSDESPVWIR